MVTDMLEIQQTLRSRGILISFTGKLTQALIVEYGEAVKSYLEMEDRPKNEIFNIFSLFIEQTQNINNYNASKASSPNYDVLANSSIVTIGKSDSGNYVCSGNLIANEDAPQLQAYLDSLIPLNKAGLKALYKAKLKTDLPSEAESAGLGMIEMARKASSPLEYSMQQQDDRFTFFTLKTVV